MLEGARMSTVVNLHYFNTAAIGQPSPHASKVVGAFERIRDQVGWASIRSRKLIKGEPLRFIGELGRDYELLSEHWRGIDALAISISRMLGIKQNVIDIILTTGTSRAIELVLSALTDEGYYLVTTDLEHESEFRVISAIWKGEYNIIGLKRDLLSGINEDEIIDRVVSNLRDRSVLLISHVTSMYGTTLPIQRMIERARIFYKEVIVVVDGAHGPGNIEVDIDQLNADVYIGSGHKWLRGPETSGFLLIGEPGREVIAPKINRKLISAYSWFEIGKQAIKRYSDGSTLYCDCGIGTKYISPLVGLMVSLNERFERGSENVHTQANKLRIHFESMIRELVPVMLMNDNIILEGSAICAMAPLEKHHRTLNTISTKLEEHFNVVCEEFADGVLRFSFSGNETEEDLLAAIHGLRAILDARR